MYIGCGLARVDGQDLLEALQGLVVLLLVPGNIAQFAQGLEVLRLALQRCQRSLFVARGNAQGKLDALIVRIELEGFAILASTLLELTPPVRQVAPENVARDTVLQRHTLLDGLLLLWRIVAVEHQEGSDIIGKPG